MFVVQLKLISLQLFVDQLSVFYFPVSASLNLKEEIFFEKAVERKGLSMPFLLAMILFIFSLFPPAAITCMISIPHSCILNAEMHVK